MTHSYILFYLFSLLYRQHLPNYGHLLTAGLLNLQIITGLSQIYIHPLPLLMMNILSLMK